MDSIVSLALEEICAEGPSGISLPKLWLRLQNPLSSSGLYPCDAAIKQSIWNGLLKIPSMQFEAPDSSFACTDPSIQTVEGSEKLGLKIIAPQHLRDSFLGIDDLNAADSGTSSLQRRILERIAVSRKNGITQSEISKEFGVKGNNLFYIVRNLECRRLIVRQSTILRTKEHAIEGENGTKSNPVATNLLCLCRYAKLLSSQQRLEITKPDAAESFGDADGDNLTPGECSNGDVLVKDYLPAMKAICNKLEEANSKVLVVSDLKEALGYRKTQGHRAWRSICNRLIDAHLVEEFLAKVDEKPAKCLRLLKKFDPKDFRSKTVTSAYDGFETDQSVKCGKRGQVTDLLVELPLEHQVHDIIEAEGKKGLTIMEVCKRLGLDNKKNHRRLDNMFSRFGMPVQAENHKKSIIYRVWTPGKFRDKEYPGNNESDQTCGSDPQNLRYEDAIMNHDVKIDTVNEVPALDATLEPSACNSFVPSKVLSCQRNPFLTTAVSAQREQGILKRLQDERFILMAELRKWLEGLEKEKPTMMDRRTLTRILNRLQQQGQCKCILVSVPLVSNCGRSRTAEVVLHPSVEGLPPEILCQIREKLKLFDTQTRGQGLARLKNDSVPVLTGIKRTSTNVASDGKSHAEAMRANGFVPAKLVRAKLLHNFLWGYLSDLPDWHDALSSGKHGYDPKNCHSTCKLFAMDIALKAMPLEMFLQVVGSAQKFEDLVESCRRGLHLSDLPPQEYRSLLDNQANERLSRIIDILFRLKLICLASGEHAVTVERGSCAVLMHAMELRPYIEEPLFRALRSSTVNSFDLRPRVRHEFILSSKEAVEAYWKTLEYCYSAADPAAASHAFPGSAVPEVFHCRLWASARVMTTDQRVELLNRVASNDPGKKVSFRECTEIAAELNLTLEQVLCASYDMRRSLLPILSERQEFHEVTRSRGSYAKKRKRPSEKPSNLVKGDPVNGESSRPGQSAIFDSDVENMEQQSACAAFTEDHNSDFQACDEDNPPTVVDVLGTNEEDGENHSFISQCALARLRPSRRRRFSWTEKSDRQLVIQYARQRAALGARYNRVDWASIYDLPAPPDTCRRRMAMLNTDPSIRRAVIKLCSLLSERYVKHLDRKKDNELNTYDDSHEKNLRADLKEFHWDDFEDENIKMAVNEVMHCKRMANPDASKRIGASNCKEWPDLPQLHSTNLSMDALDPQEVPGLISSSNPGKGIHNHVEGSQKDQCMLFFAGRSRSSSQHIFGKLQNFLSSEDINKKVCKSLAIANAIELLKVAFLSTSTAPEVPKLLEGTLRRYSERDLISAFNYLKDKKFMVIGSGSRPFVFCRKFWYCASSSPFPVDTGKRAVKFAKWLHKREEDLLEDETNLSADLHCGDILHLFAAVSLGELSISPSLPAEGIGEADEQMNLKRKTDRKTSFGDVVVKKHKVRSAYDSEMLNRREKGFPGIQVAVSRGTYSRAEAIEFFTKDMEHNSLLPHDETYPSISSDSVSSGTASPSNDLSQQRKFVSNGSSAIFVNEHLWETIASYAELSTSKFGGSKQVASFCPELFKTVYIAVYKAGEQGLNMEEVSKVMNMHGENMAEFIVEMLIVFGLVIKVNAYDCVHALDASYGPKYFLSPVAGHCQDAKLSSHLRSEAIDNQHLQMLSQQNHEKTSTLPKETTMNLHDGHKVTVLDFPDDSDQLHGEYLADAKDNKLGCHMQDEACCLDRADKDKTCTASDSLPTCFPILPWLNGDGSTNTIIYKGLTRRILGTVMQNPGIVEEDIIQRMDVLNPQSCRKLLELLVLDNHLIVKEMHQTSSCSPPALLSGLLKSDFRSSRPASVFRKHFFANPLCASLL